MKVLMTADTVGGVWTYVLELARALASQGCQVVLATMGAGLTPEQRRAAQAVPGLEVRESRFKLEWMPDPWEDVARAGEWLLAVEAEVAPDCIHLNGFSHGALPWQAPCLVVGHSCVLSWWAAVHGEAAPPDWRHYQAQVQRGLQAAHLVAAPSRAMLAALQRHYGPLPPSLVIPNGRAAGYMPGPKQPFIFSAGRLWDAAKNLAALAAAAAGLAWPVYVAGDTQPPHPDAGPARPPAGVRWLGRLEPVALGGWFAGASLYALPARYEPFGLSVLEAAQAGCALVLGDVPSLRENWEGGAVFVPPDNAGALHAALAELIAQPARRLALAAAARQRALAFTPERMAAAYRAAYERARAEHVRRLVTLSSGSARVTAPDVVGAS